MKKKALITTLGCKVNQFESAAFKTAFEEAGLQVVCTKENADVVVINTCTVTEKASAQSRQSVRQALRRNPGARIIITGCYSEIGAKELESEKELQGRDYTLIGNSNKDNLVSAALGTSRSPNLMLSGVTGEAKEICRLPVRRFGERSRAYLRVQDGCESFCTYCIVPYTRGPSRSLPIDEVIKQAKVFSQEGHREIVITGIHLGYYGADLSPREDIVSLVDKLCKETPDTCYRISSLEPLEITDKLLSLMKEKQNIQPHLHIPLQSGNDEILAKMNRRYTTDQFKAVIERCHNQVPDLAVGIDILAGFPGETDAHFTSALNFLAEIEFTYLHVFPYSIRPGTVAATFTDQLPKKTKEKRVAKLRELSDSRRDQFYKQQLGKIKTVLVEGKRDKDGHLKGFTDNYIAVRFDGPDVLLNNFATVKLESFHKNHVLGARVNKNES